MVGIDVMMVVSDVIVVVIDVMVESDVIVVGIDVMMVESDVIVVGIDVMVVESDVMVVEGGDVKVPESAGRTNPPYPPSPSVGNGSSVSVHQDVYGGNVEHPTVVSDVVVFPVAEHAVIVL